MEPSTNPTLATFLAERAAASKPFPLASLLYIYQVSHRKDTYCDYMEGFRLLVQWLSPIEIPTYLHGQLVHPPKICVSYEMQQIAEILGTTTSVIYTVLLESTPLPILYRES